MNAVAAAVRTPTIQWDAIAPELVLLGGAALALLLACVLRGRVARDVAAVVGIGSFVGAALAAILLWDTHGGSWSVFEGQLEITTFGNAVRVIVAVSGILTVLTAFGWQRFEESALDVMGLILVAAAGMSFVAVADSFVSLFVSLELFSITLYALCALDLRSRGSLESGFKYLVLGSVGSAVLLYGSAFLYGSTGSLEFAGVQEGIAADPTAPLALLGAALVLAGLFFKVAAVPFHMWTPDVYQGAPTPITGFMAAATKTVAFTILARVLYEALPGMSDQWQPVLAAVAVLSMVVGNVAALAQSDLKRMLAYSSIGHAGYLLIAVVAGGELGWQSLVFYLGVYVATTIGSFAVVAVRERELGEPVTLQNLRGWGWSRPILGGTMAIFLLSLAGFPLTGGFLAKLYVFGAAVEQGWTWLAIVGAVTTVISLGYYLRIGMALYDRGHIEGALIPPGRGMATASLAAVLGVAIVLWLGIYPGVAIDWARDAASAVIAAGSTAP